MKVLKFNNTIAQKIAGRLDRFNAIDPVFIKDNFWILPESLIQSLIKKYPTLVKKIKNQIKLGNMSVINLEDTSNDDVKMINSIKIETEKQAETRIATRSVVWDITKKNIGL